MLQTIRQCAALTSALLMALAISIEPAKADNPCEFLTRPAVESVDGVTRFNRWESGTQLCYSGHVRICENGRWKTYQACSEQDTEWKSRMAYILEGSTPDSSSSSSSSSSSTSNTQTSGGSLSSGSQTAALPKSPLDGTWCLKDGAKVSLSKNILTSITYGGSFGGTLSDGGRTWTYQKNWDDGPYIDTWTLVDESTVDRTFNRFEGTLANGDPYLYNDGGSTTERVKRCQ